MILDRVAPPLLRSALPLDGAGALLRRLLAAAPAVGSAPTGRRAYWAGFAAYQEGRDLGDNPHRAGSRKAEAWLLGWCKGLED